VKRDREAVHRYLEENPDDELESALSGEEWEKVKQSWLFSPGYGSDVVHHIYRGSVGHKYDITSLMITVSALAHDFVHRHPKHGVIAALYVKHRKEEYDREYVKQVVGIDIVGLVDNWLSNGDVTHPYYSEIGQTILERYEGQS